MSPDAVASFFQLGTRHHQAGRLKDAENCYRGILSSQPEHVFCLQQYGLLLVQLGRLPEAVRHLEKSCQLKSDHPAFWNNLGEVYRQADRLVDAQHAFERSIRLNNSMPESHYNLGNVLKQMGRHGEAVTQYNVAIKLNPKYDRAYYNLANTLREEGRVVTAELAYRKALELKPDWSDCHLNLANALYDLKKLDEAVAEYKKAGALKPADADIDDSLGNCFVALGMTADAQMAYRRANSRRPEKWLRSLRCDLLAPPVAPLIEFIDEYRVVVSETLDKYAERPMIDPAELHPSGAEPPMLLAYHGRHDRALKERYSKLLTSKLATVEPPALGQGKPRIGVVVTNGHEGVFARCLGELIVRLDPAKLDVKIIASRAGANVLQHMMPGAKFDGLILPDRVDHAAELIRRVGFDLLLYWEIGTDSMNYFLPLFRPAPIQATCWGWPVTSGHACVDDFVSWSDLEPEGADSHYTERLVRLQRPPTFYMRPPVPATPRGKVAYGFDVSQHVYLCQQNVRKYHLDFDAVLGEILRTDPHAVIAAIADEQPAITALLTDRWQRTIPDVANRIRVLGRLEREAYLDLVASADIVLDTPYYGGGANTVLDAVAAGTPVVTWAGPQHRGRWAAAINRRLGLGELVAETLGEYAGIATRAAGEPQMELRRTIATAGAELFSDAAAVREWEEYLLARVAAR